MEIFYIDTFTIIVVFCIIIWVIVDNQWQEYYHTNNNFKLLTTINASDLSAGNSYENI